MLVVREEVRKARARQKRKQASKRDSHVASHTNEEVKVKVNNDDYAPNEEGSVVRML